MLLEGHVIRIVTEFRLIAFSIGLSNTNDSGQNADHRRVDNQEVRRSVTPHMITISSAVIRLASSCLRKATKVFTVF